ncbi:MAG: hypothetical protein SGILL_008061, partial [Bacillariaceae sp.]
MPPQQQLQHSNRPPPDEAPSWFVVQLTATASLGGLLFGYDMGAISGALPQLQQSFDLSETQLEWLVSILFIGGGVGASIGGSVCDWCGRKVTIMMTDVVFMVGAAWLYFAGSYHSILMGRFVVGVGVAVSGVADVSYLHECAPVEWRGSIVSVNEACISLGFLLAYVAGYVYTDADKEEWRIIFGWAGVIAAVQLVGMFRLPESPAWLTEQGRTEDARLAWQQINSGVAVRGRGSTGSSIDDEHNNDSIHPVLGDERTEDEPFDAERIVNSHGSGDIVVAGLADTLESSKITSDGISLEETYQHPKNEIYDGDSIPSMPSESYRRCGRIRSWLRGIGSKLQSTTYILSRYRRQSYIALFLSVVQQFCGQTIVLNYAPMIFAEAARRDADGNDVQGDDSGEAPDWSTVAIGLVKFAVTVLVIWRIEYIGRRILLLAGTSLIAIGLAALIIAFGGSTSSSSNEYVDEADEAAADQSNEKSFWSPLTNLKTFHLALPGVLLVVTGYSMSFGPLTWLLTSELFPTDIRGRALGVSTIVTFACAAVVTRTFLSAQTVLGPSKVFAIYCVITIFGLFFEYLAIPDTGEKTVEQIDDALGGMYWWRFDAIALSQIDQDATASEGRRQSSQSQIEMSPSP